jgi:molybdopterin-guanine dinucleotide biosynthesis protein B
MILGVYGYQDAGKTVLVEDLVRALVKKGYRVSSIKHTPHDKTVDCEGKDTWRHWKAGSDPVVFSSSSETSIIKHSGTRADEIAALVMREYRPDVLLIEGFKEGAFPKVAVGRVRSRKGTVLKNPGLDLLVEYVETEVEVERTVAQLPGLDCGKCGMDCDGLARAIVAGKMRLNKCRELPDVSVEIYSGGRRVAAGRFVSNLVDGTIRGMLGTLKGYRLGDEVEIRLEAKGRTPRKGGRGR